MAANFRSRVRALVLLDQDFLQRGSTEGLFDCPNWGAWTDLAQSNIEQMSFLTHEHPHLKSAGCLCYSSYGHTPDSIKIGPVGLYTLLPCVLYVCVCVCVG